MPDMERIDEGYCCDHCGQWVQRYRRQMYYRMVEEFATFVNLGDGWYTSQEIVDASPVKRVGGGDFAKLRYWGLIEMSADQTFHLTPLGRAFYEGTATVPRQVYVYNGIACGFVSETDRISYQQALVKKYKGPRRQPTDVVEEAVVQ